MAISKVGLGWDVGERDYASLNLWVSGKSASGVAEQAHCKGSCTTATLNITSGFAAGALIYGDVEYDGSNESVLAFANNRINITVANVIAQDLLISQSSNFLNTVDANGSGVVFRRCRIKHLGAHGASYAALKALNGGAAENCVASTAGARITNHSFNNPLTFSNCLFFGSTGIGVGPIYSTFQTVINCFSFNNAGDDFFGANPADETFNCASEDLTGNVTGYTSAECVDFANNDFRIKSTSDLHALNIGAFFESAGGVAITPESGVFSYIGGAVQLIVNRTLTPESGVFSYSGSTASLIIERAIQPDVGIYSYNGASVEIVYNANTGITIAPESGVFSYSGGAIDLTISRIINPEAGAFNYAGGSVELDIGKSINPEAGIFNYIGGDVELLLSRVLTPQVGIFSYIGGAVAIIYSGQVIRRVTNYSVNYEQEWVSVDYEPEYTAGYYEDD
jgi:hypothetical protein